LLLSPRTKFKSGDERQAYAIEHPEPLLQFALCSGSHSDPAVLYSLSVFWLYESFHLHVWLHVQCRELHRCIYFYCLRIVF
jgi:hypothetical protein